MGIKQQDDYLGIKRLQNKSSKEAIIQKLSMDFNLTPIIAEAYYSQFSSYYEEHSNVSLSSGEISYEAVSADEPAGKHIRLTKKTNVRLKLLDFNTDLTVLSDFGIAGVRRHRLARITKEAYEQGALLSYEDLAMLLTTSASTIKRDVQFLNNSGMFIVTRGAKLDMGPGLSHKTVIIDYYFKNYTFTEIEKITNHSEVSIKRYLNDFLQIASLHRQGFLKNQIRLIAQKSDRLIREYLQLYESYNNQNCERLIELLSPQESDKDAKKKSTIKQV